MISAADADVQILTLLNDCTTQREEELVSSHSQSGQQYDMRRLLVTDQYTKKADSQQENRCGPRKSS
jgi:hypothetical protein